ncbi:hypothetical protein SAMN05216174_103283 [Actinokineospora iranica]|uniref:Uncharacterized protein n=1 Tax=Actinokineospora iranica TaxID=1271860 RepID=A0A1G6NBJ0_9PSEU|nr:hypothetical protein SAMN05216174_103283 [Actinokineospora iranica]
MIGIKAGERGGGPVQAGPAVAALLAFRAAAITVFAALPGFGLLLAVVAPGWAGALPAGGRAGRHEREGWEPKNTGRRWAGTPKRVRTGWKPDAGRTGVRKPEPARTGLELDIHRGRLRTPGRARTGWALGRWVDSVRSRCVARMGPDPSTGPFPAAVSPSRVVPLPLIRPTPRSERAPEPGPLSALLGVTGQRMPWLAGRSQRDGP